MTGVSIADRIVREAFPYHFVRKEPIATHKPYTVKFEVNSVCARLHRCSIATAAGREVFALSNMLAMSLAAPRFASCALPAHVRAQGSESGGVAQL